MNKTLMIPALFGAFWLQACAEEAAAPTVDETVGDDAAMQDDMTPGDTMPGDAMVVDPPSEAMPEGEVLNDVTGEAATSGEDMMTEESMSEKDAREATQNSGQ